MPSDIIPNLFVRVSRTARFVGFLCNETDRIACRGSLKRRLGDPTEEMTVCESITSRTRFLVQLAYCTFDAYVRESGGIARSVIYNSRMKLGKDKAKRSWVTICSVETILRSFRDIDPADSAPG